MREIRPYGSVRGVRRNPYPYRDMRKPHAKHGKKRQCGTYPGDATVILHRAGITTRKVEDQTRTWDCIGQVLFWSVTRLKRFFRFWEEILSQH